MLKYIIFSLFIFSSICLSNSKVKLADEEVNLYDDFYAEFNLYSLTDSDLISDSSYG